MSIRNYPGLVSGVTSNLPGDLVRRPVTTEEIRHAAQYRPGSVAVGTSDSLAEMVIRLPGVLLGKPRMTRRDKWKQRPCVLRYREWCDQLRAAAGPVPPAESVIELSWVATFSPPPSWPKKRRVAAIGELHRVRPDRDNVDKQVLDALYPDGDSAIARGTIDKRWGWDAGIEIRIIYRREEP